MSPRRSSRARTTQPTPAPPTHTNSSTSTSSLTRAERNTRSNNRMPSPRQTSTQRSDSLDADSAPRVEPLAPRRSRRGNDGEKDNAIQTQQEEEEEMEGIEEEITRCACGHAEYPGPPTEIRDEISHQDAVPEDLGNFFIQCDSCHVWQHGGCMGLTDESMTPEEYYCEQCKPEFHKVLRGANGIKSSLYLPVLEAPTSRSSSLSSSSDRLAKRDSKSNQSETAMSTKRRATMNSRGAYDEDEMLRRAIEESKEMGSLGKRTREESEDHKQNPKRQRTSSSSPSSLSKRSRSPSQDAADREGSRNGTNGARNLEKIRGAVARTNREKELRDQQREQAAAQRAEAASKRNARSERRRGEDSPPPTPTLSPSKPVSQSISLSHKANGLDPSPTHKSNINNLRKTGRPPARRGRLGRNQYTRDHPLNGEMSDTPLRDTSNDRNGHPGGSPQGINGINGESGRSSKVKTHPARTSMNEMKRRVAAILEFVGRMQTERTPLSQHTSGSASSKGNSTPNGVSTGSGSGHSASSSAMMSLLPTASLVRAVEAGLKDVSESNGEPLVVEKNFAEMGSGEMMETLARELVGWQSVYGKYGEKQV